MSRQPKQKKSAEKSPKGDKPDEITVDLGHGTIFHITSEDLAEWTDDFANLNREHRKLIKAGRVSVDEMNRAMDF